MNNNYTPSTIHEFWEKHKDCQFAVMGRMYKVQVCEQNPYRRIMCCDSICPLQHHNHPPGNMKAGQSVIGCDNPPEKQDIRSLLEHADAVVADEEKRPEVIDLCAGKPIYTSISCACHEQPENAVILVFPGVYT